MSPDEATLPDAIETDKAPLPVDLIGEHTQAKEDHVASLRAADAGLALAQAQIADSRARLQRVLDLYEERRHGPR